MTTNKTTENTIHIKFQDYKEYCQHAGLKFDENLPIIQAFIRDANSKFVCETYSDQSVDHLIKSFGWTILPCVGDICVGIRIRNAVNLKKIRLQRTGELIHEIIYNGDELYQLCDYSNIKITPEDDTHHAIIDGFPMMMTGMNPLYMFFEKNDPNKIISANISLDVIHLSTEPRRAIATTNMQIFSVCGETYEMNVYATKKN